MPDKIRCGWAQASPLEQEYHDREWGRPQHDEQRLFEKLNLEAMQAGLSWSIILQKRDNFRAAFHQFNPEEIVKYNQDKIDALLNDAGIVRNRLKILAIINNAKAYLNLREQGDSLDNFLWKYVEGKPLINHWATLEEVPGLTPLSTQISKDLKKQGFKFVGPTTVYALMQSCGLVNDHLTTCFLWSEMTPASL